MSKLQVDDIVNKDDTGSAGFSRGAIVTGIATATSFSGPLTGNVTGNVTGNASGSSGSCTGNAATATTAAEATEAIAAKSGSALETSINGKTSPGKAIALSMVFG
jgi:hypothetical protein